MSNAQTLSNPSEKEADIKEYRNSQKGEKSDTAKSGLVRSEKQSHIGPEGENRDK